MIILNYWRNKVIELEFTQTSEQLLNQLFASIEMVKKFRKLMKDALKWIRRHYDTYMYIHEFNGSDFFTHVTEVLKCQLDFDLRSRKLTMKSLIDPELKESTSLLTGQAWWDFVGREQKKEEMERMEGKLYDKSRNRK